jgi:hypothetical protein
VRITSHSKGQKTVGRARTSLILANNFLPFIAALAAFIKVGHTWRVKCGFKTLS